jgi:histone deacetylase 1/2
MLSPFADEWRGAERIEFKALILNGTWVIVLRSSVPRGRIPISCRWVYKVKLNPDNTVARFKARLTARGFQQKAGIDYDETFAAVARMKSFRILVAISTIMDLVITQLDVDNAFLNGILEEEIYMHHPPGFQRNDNTVLKLKKSIYGLKQASRTWFDVLKQALLQNGFSQLLSDTCVFKHTSGVLFLSVHVDDIIVATADEALRRSVCSGLTKHFKMKQLGRLHYYIGMQVAYTPDSTFLFQSGYLERIVERFGMTDCKPASYPTTGNLLSAAQSPTSPDDIKEMSTLPYRSIVGSLLYAARASRPDICWIVTTLAKFSANPGQPHWTAAKHVLRYLSKTVNYGIRYTRPTPATPIKVEAYSDSNWAGCVDTRLSRSGGVIFLANGPVIWYSKTQKCHALSSCEAEFIALTEMLKDLKWLRSFLTELGITFDPVFRLYIDNKAAIALSKNPVNHRASKHIDLRYKFIAAAVKEGLATPIYKETNENISDVFTKNSNAAACRRHFAKLVSDASICKANRD